MNGKDEYKNVDGDYFSVFYESDHGTDVDSDDGKTPNTNTGPKSRSGKKLKSIILI